MCVLTLREFSESGLVVWRLLDGKPGHMHQSQGLVQALQQQLPVKLQEIYVNDALAGWGCALRGRWPLGEGLPAPDWIVGVGHATHGHLLAARRVYGGKAVCLMQPSVPAHWFDVCLIPEHDQYRGCANFIETDGVLNHIQPSSLQSQAQTLLLVGGPSKHYVWDDALVAAQVFTLVNAQPQQSFVLVTSRRTPASFVKAIRRIHLTNVRIVTVEQTTPDWLANTLQLSHTVWVTEDSVSMVYESLTAQAAVGLLNLSPRRESRVVRGIDRLVSRQRVVRFDFDGRYRTMLRPASGFNEAQRCSTLLLHYFNQPQRGRLSMRVS